MTGMALGWITPTPLLGSVVRNPKISFVVLGDYAGLDRQADSWKIILRQASATLCCFVAFFVGGHSAMGMQPVWSTGKEEQKFSSLPSTEGIFVAYLPTGVESSISNFYSIPTIWRYWGIVWRFPMKCSSRSHMADTGQGEFLSVRPNDIGIEGVDCKTTIHVKGNVISRGLSTIFERDFSCWVRGEEVFDDGAINKDVGPQLSSSHSNHDTNSSNKGQELEKRGEGSDSGYFIAKTPSREPTIAPLIWSLTAGSAGFGLSLLGLLYLDNERRLLGASLLCIGLLLGCGGALVLGFGRVLL
jgi:hypothetical protein